MTSLRKLEEEAAKCSDPQTRKQLLELIAQRRQRKQKLIAKGRQGAQQAWNTVKDGLPDEEAWGEFHTLLKPFVIIAAVVIWSFMAIMLIWAWATGRLFPG